MFIGFLFAILRSNLVSGSAAYWCCQGHIASALCPWSSVASSYTTEHILDRLYIRFQRCSTKNIVEISENNLLLLLFSSKLSALSAHLIHHDDNGAQQKNIKVIYLSSVFPTKSYQHLKKSRLKWMWALTKTGRICKTSMVAILFLKLVSRFDQT